jgi:enoyl-CoA hydratase/carnithine racemase
MAAYETPGATLTHEGRVHHLRFDGTRSNALGAGRYRALQEACSGLSAQDVLLISAQGRHFSAGQDLDEFTDARASGRLGSVLVRGTDAVLALLETPATVVVAVNGAAVGGGALLAAAADVPLFAADARLRLPELELGMPLGGSVLERLVGGPAARRLMLTGKWCSAPEVAGFGGATLVAPESLLSEAMSVAAALAVLEPAARTAARTLFGDGERARAARLYRAEVTATLHLLG